MKEEKSLWTNNKCYTNNIYVFCNSQIEWISWIWYLWGCLRLEKCSGMIFFRATVLQVEYETTVQVFVRTCKEFRKWESATTHFNNTTSVSNTWTWMLILNFTFAKLELTVTFFDRIVWKKNQKSVPSNIYPILLINIHYLYLIFFSKFRFNTILHEKIYYLSYIFYHFCNFLSPNDETTFHVDQLRKKWLL